MKKLLFGLVLSMVAFAANALQEIPIIVNTKTASTTTTADMYARPTDKGMSVFSSVRSVTGTVTLSFIIQEKTPTGEYVDLLTLTPVAPVVGTVNVLRLGAGITAAAGASAANQMPPVFRIRATTLGTGTSSFSIGVNRNN